MHPAPIEPAFRIRLVRDDHGHRRVDEHLLVVSVGFAPADQDGFVHAELGEHDGVHVGQHVVGEFDPRQAAEVERSHGGPFGQDGGHGVATVRAEGRSDPATGQAVGLPFRDGRDQHAPADGLFTGFYDWGTWWQGEIAGEYFLSNSNLLSHQLRFHAAPTDAIEWGVILYDFRLDRPTAAGTSSDELAREADGYLDWSIGESVKVSVVAALADPGAAVREAYRRTEQFTYGMVFVSYSY